MTVFNVERDEHAARIARKEIGQRLSNIPLEVLEVERVEEETTEMDETDEEDEEFAEDLSEPEGDEATVGGGSDSEGDRNDDEMLPEFEELIDEEER
jgi:hypothetical protein